MANPEIVDWFDKHWLNTYTQAITKGLNTLSEKDQVLALVGATFDHEIGAGRRELMCGPMGAHIPELIAAFEKLDLKEAAKSFRKFAKKFPDGTPAKDEAEREEQVSNLPKNAWKELYKFGELFEEFEPGGERVMLTRLYEWYHKQP